MGVRRAMATSQAALVLLLLVLVISCFICNTHAIPATRVGGLMHKIPRVDLHLLDQDTTMMKDEQRRRTSVKKRVAAELDLDDYPGSGANSRHTPRAAFTHPCYDC